MTDARVYSSDELEHEREMQALGESRTRAGFSRAKDSDTYAITVPGRSLLRRFALPVANLLRGWLAREDPSRAGRLGDLYPLIEDHVGPEPAALLGVQLTIDALHRPRTVNSLAAAIGMALEDQYRCRAFEANNPGAYRDIMAKAKRSKPSRRRKRVLGKGAYHDSLPERWPTKARHELGALVLDAIVTATDLVQIETVRSLQGRGKPRLRRFVVPTERVLKWLERAEDLAALASPYYYPTIETPIDWDGPEGGGYLTDLVLGRPIARFRYEGQKEAFYRSDADPTLCYEALNNLQRTAWAVNEDVRMTLEAIWEGAAGIAGLPDREDIPVPPWPPEAKTDDTIRRNHVRQITEIHAENNQLRSRRLAVVQHRIALEKFSHHERFYFPHRVDFRGRAYTMPTSISFQGPDLCRGALRFADEVELKKPEDWGWLWVHGANVFGHKGSIEVRGDWACNDGWEIAERVTEDPLENRDWTEADEPFQFLAWCFEIVHAHDTNRTSLPVHVDATNNGLQILAILSGDRGLATATNVIPTEDGEPGDSYNGVAEAVFARLQAAAGTELADFWLARLPDGIPRDAVKRPVMTLPYGVTGWSAQDYVKKWAKGANLLPSSDITLGKACLYLSDIVMEEVRVACAGAVQVMDWLQTCSNLITAEENSLRWITPNGFPVTHHYHKTRGRRIMAPLSASITQLQLREGTKNVDPRKSRQGVSPNIVHSLDAAVLHEAVARFDGPIGTVHDAFATVSPAMPELLRYLKQAVVDVVQSDYLNTLRDFWQREYRLSLPDPPAPLGVIQPTEILQSDYIFS